MRLFVLLAALCTLTARTANSQPTVPSTSISTQQGSSVQQDDARTATAVTPSTGTVGKECGTEDLHASATERLNPFSKLWDNSIVVCALMRMEQTADVREWLAYHRWVGVDHILLHDNNEDGGRQAAEVQDFIDSGFVSYYQIEGEKLQLPLYETCVQRAKAGWAWLAAIDIDEFLVVKDPAVRGQERPLKAVLEQHRFHTGLWLQWITYGPAEHDRRPPVGGPLKHYDQCVRTQSQMNMFGKSIGNTFWLKKGSSAHGFLYRASAPAYSDSGQPLKAAFDPQRNMLMGAHTYESVLKGGVVPEKNARLAVHHYSTRSREDFDVKQMRGAGDHARNVTYRDTSFFDDRKAEQKRDEECQDTVRIADECCYRDGLPFPPLPLAPAVPPPPPPILPLRASGGGRMDTCTARLPLETNPMYTEWEARIAVCSLLEDASMTVQDLRAWVDHYKRIGVARLALFVEGSNTLAWADPEAAAYVDAEVDSLFLKIHSVPEDSQRHSLHAANALCIQEYARNYSFIMFLRLGEYVMVQAPKQRPPDLRALLSEPAYRYSSGVVLPLYRAAQGASDAATDDGLVTHECWQGGQGLTRTIANTFWLIESLDLVRFRFRGDLIPVSDAGVQWLAATQHWPLPNITQPLVWHTHTPMPHSVTAPDALAGLGSRLRVVAPERDGERLVGGAAAAAKRRWFLDAVDETDPCREPADSRRAVPTWWRRKGGSPRVRALR